MIRVYHTHIEIFPYTEGENIRVEKYLSAWIDAEYRYDPMGYCILNDILYVPRGINLLFLQKEFNSTPVIVKEPDKYDNIYGVYMTVSPRNDIQRDAIDFLSSDGKFKNTIKYSQKALLLDTGDGKTYSAIHSIINLRMKALIITHQDKIKTQWMNQFLKFTNVSKYKLINIHGSDMMTSIVEGQYSNGQFFFINHQTISSYTKRYGYLALKEFFKQLRIGIKIYDEAQYEFKNMIRTDMFSNVKNTFYLTANFDRSNTIEGYLYKKCFSSVCKFGEETKEYDGKRKHIVYIPILYKSCPSFSQQQAVYTNYGFSIQTFSKYALHQDSDHTQLNMLFWAFEKAIQLEGRILITTPKIDDTIWLMNLLKDKYPGKNRIYSTINSCNTKQQNINAKDTADVILSTIKSCGTGVDISRLRCVINLEPFSSKITTNQLAGRLREFDKIKDTYLFDLIDISFPSCENQYKTKSKYLKKKCKEIKEKIFY